MKLTTTSILLVALAFSAYAAPKKPISPYAATPHNTEGVFSPNPDYSSEFDGALNNDNFYINEGTQAVWSLERDNIQFKDGILHIIADYAPKTLNNGKEFYLASGMVVSKELTTYGYFEARIKGADLWPGVCPAFWLTSGGTTPFKMSDQENTITYSEVDIIEIQQIARDKNIMACNLHTGALITDASGKKRVTRLSAGMVPKIGRNEFKVDWDAEDEYHIYACENRPDSIIFYIDNKRVAAKPNYYWHLPMFMKLSMGIRTPYESYKGGTRHALPVTAEEAAAAGFPTTTYVDYVRSYTRDYSTFKSNKKLFDRKEADYDPLNGGRKK
ncbi:MAG: family 16 glycosylhydrolase [Rikenellaceae bacterium]